MSALTETATLVHSRHRRLLADTLTPVSLYLRLRDQFVGTLLLESSDYHGHDNSFSYLCFSPVARFELDGGQLTIQHPGRPPATTPLPHPRHALARVRVCRRLAPRGPYPSSRPVLAGVYPRRDDWRARARGRYPSLPLPFGVFCVLKSCLSPALPPAVGARWFRCPAGCPGGSAVGGLA